MPELGSKALIRIAVAAVIFSGFGVSSAYGAQPQIAIDWNLPPASKVGSHKSGLACFPNGALRWSEIAKPDIIEIANHVENPPTSMKSKVSGKLLSIKASVCTPWLGVGESQPKSEIKIFMKWIVYNADGTSSERVVETAIARKQHDLRFDAALFAEAIETSLRRAMSQDS